MVKKRRLAGRILLFGLLFSCLTCVLVYAFPFEIKPAAESVIEKMKNEGLIDAYVDAVIEIEAVRMFYHNSGITPKEYDKFKKLLYYRVNLIKEMKKRGIPLPQVK